jgi:hypothetical protein
LRGGHDPALSRQASRVADQELHHRERWKATAVHARPVHRDVPGEQLGWDRPGLAQHDVQDRLDELQAGALTLLTASKRQARQLGFDSLGLGPAFGTKFLFYQNEQALILDRLSGRWFKSVTDISLRPTVWRHDKYAFYLKQMQEWAARDDLSPARVEQAAFQLMSERESNQWAA